MPVNCRMPRDSPVVHLLDDVTRIRTPRGVHGAKSLLKLDRFSWGLASMGLVAYADEGQNSSISAPSRMPISGISMAFYSADWAGDFSEIHNSGKGGFKVKWKLFGLLAIVGYAALLYGPSTALAAPTLSKVFAPPTLNAGGVATSTLFITLSNPDPGVATLTAPLVDTLPSGVVIADPPNPTTSCPGSGAPLATAGGSTVSLLVTRSIPAAGSCTVTVNVIATVAGSYVNTIAAGALQTSNGNNAAPASGTLTVSSSVPAIPTLSEWAMIMFAALLALLYGLAMVRRQAK